MEPEDHEVVRACLDETGRSLFYSMDTAIQKHCVKVASTVSDMIPAMPGIDRSSLIQAALLHDIGKSKGSFTLMDRVWFVLIRKFLPGLAAELAGPGRGKRLPGLRNAFHTHMHHEEIGASIARRAGLSEEIVFLLRHHHNKEAARFSKELAVLLRADELQ